MARHKFWGMEISEEGYNYHNYRPTLILGVFFMNFRVLQEERIDMKGLEPGKHLNTPMFTSVGPRAERNISDILEHIALF